MIGMPSTATTPRPEDAAVTDAHLAAAYLAIVKAQALEIAKLTAYAEALAAHAERQAEQLAQLRMALARRGPGGEPDGVAAAAGA